MTGDQHEMSDQDLRWAAARELNDAYRKLGDAADDVRGLVDDAFFRAIREAKDAINRAKDIIGA